MQQSTLANKKVVGQLQNEMLQPYALMQQRVKLLNAQWEIGVDHEARKFTFASIGSLCNGLAVAPQSRSHWQFDHAAARHYSMCGGAGAQVRFLSKKLAHANAAWEFAEAGFWLRRAQHGHLRR